MPESNKLYTLLSRLLLLIAFSVPLSIDTHLRGDSLGISMISEPLCLITALIVGVLTLKNIKQLRLNYLDSVVFFHVLALIVSSIFSWSSIMSLKYSFIVSTYIIAVYFGFRLIPNKDVFLKNVLIAFLSGHLALALFSFVNFIRLGIFYETSYIVAQPFVMQGHSNLSVLLEAPVLLATVLLLQKNTKKSIRSLLIFAVFTFIAVICFSCSRTSYITLSTAFTVLFFFNLSGDTKKKLLIYVGAPLVVIIGIWKINDLVHYYQYRDDPNSYYTNKSAHYNSNDVRTYKQTNMWEEMWDISDTENRAGKSSAERIYRWFKGWQLWRDVPLNGIGPGTFANRYLEVAKNPRNEYERILAEKKMNIHNLYLAWLFEGGLFVFITGIGIILFIVQTGIRMIREKAPPMHRALVVAFVPFLIHSLVQDYWNEPRVALSFWLGLAVLNYFNSKNTSHSDSTPAA